MIKHGLDDGSAERAAANGEVAPAGETEYDMTAWPTQRRMELVGRLVELGVPHHWEGDLLLVPTNLEGTVDVLLDDMEGGSLAHSDVDDENEDVDDDDPGALDPAEALSSLFLAGERMRRHKVAFCISAQSANSITPCSPSAKLACFKPLMAGGCAPRKPRWRK